MDLMLASTAEATCTTFAVFEVVDDIEVGLHYRHHHQLREPFHRIQHERDPPRFHVEIISGPDNPDRSADQIAQHDAVLMAQTRARQNQRGIARIAD